MRNLNFYLLLTMLLILISCKKEEAKPVFDPIPHIAFLEMSPGSVKAYKDSVSFVISYEDGDGDLGENTAGSENLFLKDLRTGASYTFRIRRLVPGDEKAPIKGTLKFVLPFVILTDDSSTQQEVRFEIKLRDRAGNESNTVQTGMLQVNR